MRLSIYWFPIAPSVSQRGRGSTYRGSCIRTYGLNTGKRLSEYHVLVPHLPSCREYFEEGKSSPYTPASWLFYHRCSSPFFCPWYLMRGRVIPIKNNASYSSALILGPWGVLYRPHPIAFRISFGGEFYLSNSTYGYSLLSIQQSTLANDPSFGLNIQFQ